MPVNNFEQTNTLYHVRKTQPESTTISLPGINESLHPHFSTKDVTMHSILHRAEV